MRTPRQDQLMARVYDVLTMGRSSIDLYAHQIGVPITEVTSFDAYVGGCPTNISVGTRRLGLRSVLLTAVGDDQVGDFVLAFLRREGVDVEFIPRKPGRRTSAVVLTIQPPDRFPLTFYREGCADRELTCDDVRRAPIEDSAMVVLTGTGLSHEPARAATFCAAERAAAASAEVLIDLDYRVDQWSARSDYAGAIQRLLRGAAMAVGTEEEIIAAADTDDLSRAIARVLGAGPQALIVKHGAKGASVCVSGGDRRHVPPFRVDVLNVLGAGDAFASGLIAGLRHSWPLERAVRMGNAAGAIVVTRHGCANFMPTRTELEDFVREHGGW
jgi:5-dehydro-2-deoxygluconokinase